MISLYFGSLFFGLTSTHPSVSWMISLKEKNKEFIIILKYGELRMLFIPVKSPWK